MPKKLRNTKGVFPYQVRAISPHDNNVSLIALRNMAWAAIKRGNPEKEIDEIAKYIYTITNWLLQSPEDVRQISEILASKKNIINSEED